MDGIDLTEVSLYANGVPHDLFTDLRLNGPVHGHRPVSTPEHQEETPFWVVVGHAEIEQANRDWQTFSAFDGPGLLPIAPERRGHTLVAMDAPDHTRLRRLVSAGFTPRMIARLEDRIVERTNQILDAAAAKTECAADEIVRWASPVLYFGRTATRDAELGATHIAVGDRVTLWYPSGNRDDKAFHDPFRFDIHRRPNPHVSFGGRGPHYCLGASLAKKEVQVMTRALLERFADIEILAPPTWSGAGPIHNVGVSVEHLPVRLRN